MPKIVTEHEKQMIQEAIYKNTINLIQKKGLKGVTVDNITATANMAKGSFYSYYPSKEECLYDVIRKCESEMFNKIEHVLSEQMPKKEQIVKLIHEIYLAEDSLVLYIKPKDLETLLRKLPPEYAERENKKSENYFERTLQLFEMDRKQVNRGVLSYLMDSLHFIASKRDEGMECQQALELIINTIAEYMANGSTNKRIEFEENIHE